MLNIARRLKAIVCCGNMDMGEDDIKRLEEAFEMWLWRRMEIISWLERVTSAVKISVLCIT